MDPDKRRSRYGYIILLNSNMIAFGTGLAKYTATSTPEAEYVAIAHGLKELLWVYQLLLTMGVSIRLPITILEDNQACIQIADNPVSQRRTRHIDVRFHFIRDYVEDGTVKLKYCITKDMLADIMTKTMSRPEFQRLRAKIIKDATAFLGDDMTAAVSYCRSIYKSLLR